MKLSDIVYPIVKPNVEFAISIYHRKIYFSNAQRVPKDRPVFFLSNHPTAFLEPVIYSGLLDKPIHSLVRGDFFQNKIAKTALESLNMIPIYRMRDGGVEGLRKNAETFQYCYDLLAKNEQVLIMAEGLTKHQKRLAPLQKGAARMALGAAQGRKLNDLLVIPLGASFTNANTFRGEVMIDVGEPIEINQYLENYRADKKSTIDQLTADMEVAMKRTIVHIDNERDDALFEKIIPIIRRRLLNTLWPSWVRSDLRFTLEKNCANKINDLSEDEKNFLLDQLKDYSERVALRSDRKLINCVILFFGFPIWLAGTIYRFIPFSIARGIVNNKVKEIEFESPVRFGMGTLFTGIFTLLILVVTALAVGLKLIWLPIFMLLVVWFSVIYEDLWNIVQEGINWNKLSEKERSKMSAIESTIQSMI